MERAPPAPLAADIAASATFDGHPYVFRVLEWREGEWRVFAHYRTAAPAHASQMAHDMEGWLAKRIGRRNVMVDVTAMPGQPVLPTDFEVIDLADGPADQFVVPTVQPVSHAARQIAQERSRRAARHGASHLPAGGLFDETARAQQELF